MLKISSQSDKQLWRKTQKFCADKQTDRQIDRQTDRHRQTNKRTQTQYPLLYITEIFFLIIAPFDPFQKKLRTSTSEYTESD